VIPWSIVKQGIAENISSFSSHILHRHGSLLFIQREQIEVYSQSQLAPLLQVAIRRSSCGCHIVVPSIWVFPKLPRFIGNFLNNFSLLFVKATVAPIATNIVVILRGHIFYNSLISLYVRRKLFSVSLCRVFWPATMVLIISEQCIGQYSLNRSLCQKRFFSVSLYVVFWPAGMVMKISEQCSSHVLNHYFWFIWNYFVICLGFLYSKTFFFQQLQPIGKCDNIIWLPPQNFYVNFRCTSMQIFYHNKFWDISPLAKYVP
jgi:hypothetical protein